MTDILKYITRLLQILCLVMIDLCAFYASLFIAWIVRAEMMPYFISNLPVFSFSYGHFISFWWIPLIFISFISFEALYVRNLPFWDEARNMVKSITHASITLMAIVTLGKMGDIVSRLVLLSLWLISVFSFPVFRLWGKKVLYAIGLRREKILIIGAGNAGRLVMDGLQREKHMGYDVIGFLDDDPQKTGKSIYGKKVFGNVDEFPGI